MRGDDQLHIRPATIEDMPVVGHVLGADQAHFYRNRLARPGVVLSAWLEDQLAAAIYVCWEPADEPEVRQHLPGVPLLHRLRVRPDLRRRQIGTQLIEEAEKLLRGRGHKLVAVGVDPDNKRAAGLYEHLHYREWEHGEVPTTREVYVADGSVRRLPDRCRIFVKSLV